MFQSHLVQMVAETCISDHSLSQFPLTLTKWRAEGKLRISMRVGHYSSSAGISRASAGKAQVRNHGAERPNQSLKGKMEGKPTEEKVRIPFPPKNLLASNLGLKGPFELQP